MYIISFGVDVQKIKHVFNSKDEALFQAISSTDTFIGYADQDFRDATPTAEALHHIIYGEPYNHQSAHSYGYALICICAYIGTDLSGDSDFKMAYVTDLIDEYLAADFDITDVASAEDLLDDTLDLGLPPVPDFPMTGFLSAAEIDRLHHELAAVVITPEQLAALEADSDDQATAYEAIQSFKARIDYCYQQQLELLSFCH